MEMLPMSSSQDGHNSTGLRKTTSPRKDNENHALPAMPLGFQGMLKTSTETGDIGQFSIKPPRVPHHPAALPVPMSPRRRNGTNNTKFFPERPPDHYPYRHSITDDRRRLPSYGLAPGATFDTVSLFDTASQRSTPSSGRPFRDVEYRASSMNASSYSPYGMSPNNHSYVSLRSQPEPILQRPRSPYLYPARLKRPGFRPSSPLLSDAGIDYSRRAEIDRVLVPPAAPYMYNGRSTSPSSFYAHKRVPPPLSIRTDVNRSNPSPRKPHSPTRNQNWQNPATSDDSFRDWARRNVIAPGEVSPARSNYSYASTVNHYRSGPPASTTTTPGRLHPPSPLYYDYTEEFETEDYSEPTRDDAPPFHLEKTIPEDRPLSTGWNSLETSQVKGAQPLIIPGRSVRSSAGEVVIEGIPKQALPVINQPPDPSIPKRSRQPSFASGAGDSIENFVRMYENENDNNDDSCAAEEAPKRRFPLASQQCAQEDGLIAAELPAEPLVSKSLVSPLAEFDIGGDNVSDRSSEYSLSSNLPMHFPKPPTPLPPLPLLVDKAKGAGSGKELHLNKKLPVKPPDDSTFIFNSQQRITRAATSIAQRENHGQIGTKHKRSASTQSGHYRSSKFLSVDPGLEDLAQLVSTFEAAKARGEFGWSINTQQPQMPKSLMGNNVHSENNAQNQRAPEQRPLKQHRSESNLSSQTFKAVRHGNQEPQHLNRAVLQARTNFSTPMYAPKPISPARVAKLKKTVPQLMKALPALPRPESLRAISPPTTLPHSIGDMPFRFSPLMKPSPEPVELDSSPIESVAELPAAPKPPPKLKVRLRRSELTLPPSSETPRPWNLDENYPWSGDRALQLGSSSSTPQPNQPKIPKFKLKVSRPSVSSVETVRVNRNESRDSLGLENPRDLFTQPSRQHGLQALFSKVSSHFSHSKKSGVTGQSVSMVNVSSGGQMELRERRNNATSSDRGSSLDLGIPQLQIPIPIRTGEARSFFSDDSSQVQAGHSLRKRITNFRARLPTPYTSRTSTMATRSYDDIVYRQRSIRAANLLGQSQGDVRVENENLDSNKNNTERHRHRLRTKVTDWFGRAKNLMTGYMRPRHPDTNVNHGDGNGDE